jgi:hypothetical protein
MSSKPIRREVLLSMAPVRSIGERPPNTLNSIVSWYPTAERVSFFTSIDRASAGYGVLGAVLTSSKDAMEY